VSPPNALIPTFSCAQILHHPLDLGGRRRFRGRVHVRLPSPNPERRLLGIPAPRRHLFIIARIRLGALTVAGSPPATTRLTPPSTHPTIQPPTYRHSFPIIPVLAFSRYPALNRQRALRLFNAASYSRDAPDDVLRTSRMPARNLLFQKSGGKRQGASSQPSASSAFLNGRTT
jgi:hypothetical protein